MKIIHLGLIFGVYQAAAQVPNAPQSAVPLPAPPIAIRSNSIISPRPAPPSDIRPSAIISPYPAATGAPGEASPSTRTSPRATTQPRPNSIINPSPASTNLAVTNVTGAGQGFTVINPASKPTNAVP